MKITRSQYIKLTCAVIMGMVVCQCQLALAGWTGTMNGTGYGQASVNVRAADTSLLKKKTVTSINMQDPSASMAPTSGYATNATLPTDASAATVARIKGFTGYVWQANTVGSDGDSTDNQELENRITITAADCASLEMTSSSVTDPGGKSGTITVNALGTAGTALWLRGFEYTNDLSLLPNDDPETEENETVEFIKLHGSLKFDVLYVGPFNLTEANCSAIKIPFSIETNPDHLFFISSGVAKSLPLVVECPDDIVVDCSEPVIYPETVLVGGCGEITVSFDPPAVNPDGSFPAGYFSVGTTPVTVTAADTNGNTTTCTFNVVVTDTEAPVITATGASLALGFNPTAAQIEDALGTATAMDNCGVGTPTAQDGSVSVNGCLRSQTRTWNVTDAGNNSATPVSRTATWTVDTTPPTVSLAPYTVPCDSTATVLIPVPTAGFTDNCGGTVTVTPSTAQEYNGTGPGVTWIFTDAAGNATTNVQPVMGGLTFTGFYAPISTVSNTCTPPSVKVVNRGSVAPIKFDMFCGTTKIVGGTAPTVTIEQVSTTDCSPISGTASTFTAEYQNDWHHNWDTTGWEKATYKVTVNLPDGVTKPYVFVKIK